MAGNQGVPFQPNSGGKVPLDASAEYLAQLALNSPELWDEIWKHPNCYDGLRQWMGDRYQEQTSPQSFASEPLGAPEPQSGPVPWSGGPAASPVATTTMFTPAKPEKKSWITAPATKVTASVVAAALVLGGAGAALAMTGTFEKLFGSSTNSAASETALAASQEAELTYEQGIEELWTVSSGDFVAPLVGELGQDFTYLTSPYTRGSIDYSEADRPAATKSAVIFNARGDGSTLVMVSAKTGETLLERDLGKGHRATCVPDEFVEGSEAFFCVDAGGGENASSLLVRVGTDGSYEETSLEGINWRAAVNEDRVIVVGGNEGKVLAFDRSLSKLWQSQAIGASGFYGIDLAADRSLLRSGSGWHLVDGRGELLASADMESVYEGGEENCDARLTESGKLFVATEDASCVENPADVKWWGAGQNLGGTTLFSIAGTDFVFVSNKNSKKAQLLRFPESEVGALEVVFDAEDSQRLIAVIDGDIPALVLEREKTLSTVQLSDGTELATWPADFNRYPVLLDGNGLILAEQKAYDAYSGNLLWSLDGKVVVNSWETSAGRLNLGGGCSECSVAGGSNTSSTLTNFAPFGSGGVARGTADSATTISGDFEQVAKDAPDFVPACPTDTVLLAWMELENGWIVVCGVDIDTPSYVGYKPNADQKVSYSQGASKPTSTLAKDSVSWDPTQNRYVATMANGSVLTLDYPIGTATTRESAGSATVKAQERFVRYVFVPLGSKVRGIADAAGESGAFDVKTPRATADDQVRYMIEVLEKAYEGRALLKDALPKLAGCTAGAGGYSDTIAAMQAVRDNRAELLQALDAMPVDKIPEGKLLLADLTEAIELSHQANVEYVAWAQAANANGCASLSASGKAAADASDAPKDRFAARWNSVVAPKFKVRTFDAWFI